MHPILLYLGLSLACLLGAGQVQPAHAQQVSISSLINYPFGAVLNSSGQQDVNDNLCFYRSNNPRRARFRATGSGAGGAFTLASGGNTLTYQVFLNNNSGTVGEAQLTAGVFRNYSLNSLSTQTCGSGLNGNLHIRIPSANLQAAKAGIYTGTVTVLMEPY